MGRSDAENKRFALPPCAASGSWTERRGGGDGGGAVGEVRQQGGKRVTAAMCEANEEREQESEGPSVR